jgi:protoporphyrinogen oxidase
LGGFGLLFPRSEEERLQTAGYGPSATDPNVMYFRAAVKPHLERAWQDLNDEQYLDNLLAEVARFYPEVPPLIEDSHLTRWSEALPTYYPGYLRSLEKFVALGNLREISFCGDCLGGCATSAAYATGRRAAAAALQSLGVSRPHAP